MLAGSRHSADTMRIKEFLIRNGHPFMYQDVETDRAWRRSSTRSTWAPKRSR